MSIFAGKTLKIGALCINIKLEKRKREEKKKRSQDRALLARKNRRRLARLTSFKQNKNRAFTQSFSHPKFTLKY